MPTPTCSITVTHVDGFTIRAAFSAAPLAGETLTGGVVYWGDGYSEPASSVMYHSYTGYWATPPTFNITCTAYFTGGTSAEAEYTLDYTGHFAVSARIEQDIGDSRYPRAVRITPYVLLGTQSLASAALTALGVGNGVLAWPQFSSGEPYVFNPPAGPAVVRLLATDDSEHAIEYSVFIEVPDIADPPSTPHSSTLPSTYVNLIEVGRPAHNAQWSVGVSDITTGVAAADVYASPLYAPLFSGANPVSDPLGLTVAYPIAAPPTLIAANVTLGTLFTWQPGAEYAACGGLIYAVPKDAEGAIIPATTCQRHRTCIDRPYRTGGGGWDSIINVPTNALPVYDPYTSVDITADTITSTVGPTVEEYTHGSLIVRTPRKVFAYTDDADGEYIEEEPTVYPQNAPVDYDIVNAGPPFPLGVNEDAAVLSTTPPPISFDTSYGDFTIPSVECGLAVASDVPLASAYIETRVPMHVPQYGGSTARVHFVRSGSSTRDAQWLAGVVGNDVNATTADIYAAPLSASPYVTVHRYVNDPITDPFRENPYWVETEEYRLYPARGPVECVAENVPLNEAFAWQPDARYAQYGGLLYAIVKDADGEEIPSYRYHSHLTHFDGRAYMDGAHVDVDLATNTITVTPANILPAGATTCQTTIISGSLIWVYPWLKWTPFPPDGWEAFTPYRAEIGYNTASTVGDGVVQLANVPYGACAGVHDRTYAATRVLCSFHAGGSPVGGAYMRLPVLQPASLVPVVPNARPTVTLELVDIDTRTITVRPTAEDTDGTIASLLIQWGDGETTEDCVSGDEYSHTYDTDAPDPVSITAIARDNNNGVGSDTLVVDFPKLTLDFSVATNRHVAVATITTTVVNCTITEVVLDWGDGTIDTITDPADLVFQRAHVYGFGAIYAAHIPSVVVTATDAQTARASTIVVAWGPPWNPNIWTGALVNNSLPTRYAPSFPSTDSIPDYVQLLDGPLVTYVWGWFGQMNYCAATARELVYGFYCDDESGSITLTGPPPLHISQDGVCTRITPRASYRLTSTEREVAVYPLVLGADAGETVRMVAVYDVPHTCECGIFLPPVAAASANIVNGGFCPGLLASYPDTAVGNAVIYDGIAAANQHTISREIDGTYLYPQSLASSSAGWTHVAGTNEVALWQTLNDCLGDRPISHRPPEYRAPSASYIARPLPATLQCQLGTSFASQAGGGFKIYARVSVVQRTNPALPATATLFLSVKIGTRTSEINIGAVTGPDQWVRAVWPSMNPFTSTWWSILMLSGATIGLRAIGSPVGEIRVHSLCAAFDGGSTGPGNTPTGLLVPAPVVSGRTVTLAPTMPQGCLSLMVEWDDGTIQNALPAAVTHTFATDGPHTATVTAINYTATATTTVAFLTSTIVSASSIASASTVAHTVAATPPSGSAFAWVAATWGDGTTTLIRVLTGE